MDLNKADRTVRNLKKKVAPYSVALGNGLSCNVATNGVRTLYLRARLHGVVQRMRLGVYPETTLKAASEKADAFRASLKSGLDPRVTALRADNGQETPKNVKDAVARYLESHVKVKNRARWAKEAGRLLKVEVVPKLGRFPLAQLQRSDLAGLVEKKAAMNRAAGGKGIVANRLAAVLSKLTSYCAGQGWLPSDLGRNLPKPAVETAKKRTLTDVEMGQLWSALDAARQGWGVVLPVYARILMLLALTGCRCSEITGLRNCDIDRKAGFITIRGGKTEASNRTIPLPALARAILDEQLAGAKDGSPEALAFPSPRAGSVLPSNEISRAVRAIVKALEQTSWTPHDLRRTLATRLAEAGVSGDVARRITGHIPTDVHGAVYDRAMRYDDMREALGVMEGWVVAAAAKVAGDASNVVPLRKPL
jgi:integrase